MELDDKYLGQYMRLFCHRRDAHGVQTEEGTYYAVREPVTEGLIEAHLLGEITAGWYTLDRDNTVRWAALDADDEDEGLAQLQEIGRVLRQKEWPVYLEDSRRGGHLWLFFPAGDQREDRIGANPVRAVLTHQLSELGLEDEVELFPKQDELREGGLGNMMRGPLGVHQVCDKRFSFLELSTLKPVGSSLMEQLDYLMRFRRVTSAQVAGELAWILEQEPPTRVVHPAPASVAKDEEDGPVEELKREIGDVYSFISQFVELDEQGRGHCPFHPPDRHPSFAVNRRQNYWIDFHDMSGGDAIAFYRRFKEVDLLQAMRELALMYGREDLLKEIEGREHVRGDKEDVLTDKQLELLHEAQQGRLRCPNCGEPLRGEFIALPEVFVGLLLYCERCSYVDALSAP